MGLLERIGSSEEILLRSRFLLGRSAVCDLRVDEPRVSGEHASLRWTGAAWELRDLGSKNGTFVGDRRLAAGERVHLLAGDTLALGGAGAHALVLRLADASPPSASARHEPSGVARVATGGLILLPDDDQPEVSVLEGRDGRWLLEKGGESRVVVDKERVLVRGEAWILDLPEGTSSTIEADATIPALENISLRFVVSLDEEHVDLTVVSVGKELRLPPRGFHYLLLTLARARLGDAARPLTERGFLDRDALCRMLATDELRLNVDVHRIRKQFAALGILGAANIIERRPGTGRVRLGVDRIDVQRG